MTHKAVSQSRRSREISIGGIPIRNTSGEAVLRLLNQRPKSRKQILVGFVNAHFIVACRGLKAVVSDPGGILLLNDGVGVAIAAWFAKRLRFSENMNGSDLIPRLLSDIAGDLDVFLLGGSADVVARTAKIVNALPRRRVVGALDGFSVWKDPAIAIAAINAVRPDMLLVGFGNPKQEQWILKHRHDLHVNTIFAVGALFDWMSGERRRAPMFFRSLRAEWLYRLAIEPRRLWRRYTIGIFKFAWIVCSDTTP